MFRTSWFQSLRRRNGRPRQLSSSRAGRRRSPLILERLEDRTALSNFNAATVADLIAEINAANAGGGTNTITLTAPTTSPYVLTGVDNSTNGATGLPVISGGGKKVAVDDLTIVGNGDTIERSTASGTPAFRLFDVASGASLTTENLTLQNGLSPGTTPASGDGAGGAFLNLGTLTVNGCTMSNNSAGGPNSTSPYGGGIGNFGDKLTVTGCTLSGNFAGLDGGGIFNAGGTTATVQSTTLSGNSAYDGGGINNQGTMTVSGCTLTGNSASFGGGIANEDGVLTVSGCTLSNNSAAYDGGGIYNFDGASGGNVGSVTVQSSTLSGNVASSEGGGIYNGANATLKVQGSKVCGNTAPLGADLYNLGKLDVQKSDICVIAP
jgi:hypothetical protein